MKVGMRILTSGTERRLEMRKYIAMSVALFLCIPAFAASKFPNGIAVATNSQFTAATVATGAGDLYVADALEVDGATNLGGALTGTTGAFTGAVTSSGTMRATSLVTSTLFTIATSTPSYVGQIVLGTDYLLYVGTQTVTCNWAKIGAQ